MHTGWKLRQLFLSILCENHPSDPRQLWELFKKDLCDDLLRHLQRQGLSSLSEDHSFDYSLYLMEGRLRKEDKTMDCIGLPKPVNDWDVLLSSSTSS
ncbi:hypothetical protein EI94DRAFT_1580044 [Lactarius quietus]|nr:hypothetical protein EI94DRAFT_1580044 [Lactarius quietus]